MKKFAFLLTSYFIFLTPTFALAQSVDLLFQGDGYVPPFYEGRTLWSQQSRITLVAMPQGLGNPANLNYKWSKDGTVLGSLSGTGKDTLVLTDSILSKPLNVSVAIVSSSGEAQAERTITVVPITPSTVVYENSPLYGFMFHRAVNETFALTGAEVTFTAFPLFFSTPTRIGENLIYNWQSNNGTSEAKSSVTYRVPEGGKGSSRVSVHLTSSDNILQEARKSFQVDFGQNNVQ